jgi:hypothetical protein
VNPVGLPAPQVGTPITGATQLHRGTTVELRLELLVKSFKPFDVKIAQRFFKLPLIGNGYLHNIKPLMSKSRKVILLNTAPSKIRCDPTPGPEDARID